MITKEEIVKRLQLLADRMPDHLPPIEKGWWFKNTLQEVINNIKNEISIGCNIQEVLQSANTTWKYLNKQK